MRDRNCAAVPNATTISWWGSGANPTAGSMPMSAGTGTRRPSTAVPPAAPGGLPRP